VATETSPRCAGFPSQKDSTTLKCFKRKLFIYTEPTTVGGFATPLILFPTTIGGFAQVEQTSRNAAAAPQHL